MVIATTLRQRGPPYLPLWDVVLITTRCNSPGAARHIGHDSSSQSARSLTTRPSRRRTRPASVSADHSCVAFAIAGPCTAGTTNAIVAASSSARSPSWGSRSASPAPASLRSSALATAASCWHLPGANKDRLSFADWEATMSVGGTPSEDSRCSSLGGSETGHELDASFLGSAEEPVIAGVASIHRPASVLLIADRAAEAEVTRRRHVSRITARSARCWSSRKRAVTHERRWSSKASTLSVGARAIGTPCGAAVSTPPTSPLLRLLKSTRDRRSIADFRNASRSSGCPATPLRLDRGR